MNAFTKLQPYNVHVRYGQDLFQDILVQAYSPEDAIKKAKALTTLPTRWARFIV